jgi:hypothetical protein
MLKTAAQQCAVILSRQFRRIKADVLADGFDKIVAGSTEHLSAASSSARLAGERRHGKRHGNRKR